MTITEQRAVALRATWKECEANHINPVACPADVAFGVLDDLLRKEPTLIASKWWLRATENQMRLFKQEWRKRQKETHS